MFWKICYFSVRSKGGPGKCHSAKLILYSSEAASVNCFVQNKHLFSLRNNSKVLRKYRVHSVHWTERIFPVISNYPMLTVSLGPYSRVSNSMLKIRNIILGTPSDNAAWESKHEVVMCETELNYVFQIPWVIQEDAACWYSEARITLKLLTEGWF